MKNLLEKVKTFIENSEKFDQEFAVEVANFQIENNPIYRKFALKSGSKRINKFEDIPFMPVEFFKETEVFSCGKSSGFFLSSGTSGLKSKVPYTEESLELYRASALRSFPFKNERVLSLIPPFKESPFSSLSFMVNLFHKVKYLNSTYEIQPQEIYEKLKGREGVIFATSTQLLRLSQWMDDRGEKLNGNFTIIETGGYKGLGIKYNRDQLHKYAAQFFPHSKFWSEYGMAELFSQFYAPSGRAYKDHPYAKVLTTGKGLLRIFDFANLCTVSALLVPDLVVTNHEGFFVLGRITEEERGCGYVFK